MASNDFAAKVQVSLNKTSASSLVSEIRKYIADSTKANPIKISGFELSPENLNIDPLVNKIKSELQNALKGFGNVSIDLGGKGVGGSGTAGSKLSAEMSARLTQYKDIAKKVSSMGDIFSLAKTSSQKNTKVYQDAYTGWSKLSNAVNGYADDLSTFNGDAITGIQQQVIEVQKLIDAFTKLKSTQKEVDNSNAAAKGAGGKSSSGSGGTNSAPLRKILTNRLDSVYSKMIDDSALKLGADLEEKYKAKYDDLLKKVSDIRTKIKQPGEEVDNAKINVDIDSLNKEIEALYGEVKTDVDNAKNAVKLKDRTDELRKQLSDWISANGNVEGADKKTVDEVNGLMSQLDGDGLTKEKLDEVTRKAKELTNNFKDLGETGKSAFEKIGISLKSMSKQLLMTFVMAQIRKFFTDMINTVKELDTAMTELKKVTDLTEAGYENVVDNSAEIAKKIGATITDVFTSTADFARLGYGVEDAQELAEAALVYKNVGDGITDVSVATESLISTMKAFGVEASDAMTIVDKFNIVGNNFSISSSGVGEALQRSAAALAAGGNTLEESIALATGMNEVVQNPAQVGTALKTFSMYLRAAKTDAEEAGIETDGMAGSVSELRDELLALTGQKVDILADDNTFKSTIQIVRELAAVWNSISDVSRANILEMIGGKRNANAVTSLIENFDTVEKVLQTAQNSEGSALKENETYLNSIEGHTQRLKAQFQELSTTLIDSFDVTLLQDFGQGALWVSTGIAKVISALGGVKTVLSSIVGIILTKNAVGIVDKIRGIGDSKTLTNLKNLKTTITNMANAAKDAKNNNLGFNEALKVIGQSADISRAKLKMFIATASFTAIVAGISLVISLVEKYKQKQEELLSKATDEANGLNDGIAAFEEYSKRIEEQRAILDNNTVSESAATEARKQLLQIQGELIEQFGKEAEGINLVTASATESAEALAELSSTAFFDWEKNNKGAINNAISKLTAPGTIGDSGSALITFENENILSDLFGSGKKALEKIYPEFIKRVEEYFGKENIVTLGGSDSLGIRGITDINDAISAYSKIYDIIEESASYLGLEDDKGIDQLLENISSQKIAYEDKAKKYGSVFETYVKGLLNYKDAYSEAWGEISKAQKDYSDAMVSGNAETIKTAYDAMMTISEKYSDFNFGDSQADNAVEAYLHDLFIDFKKSTQDYTLELDIRTDITNVESEVSKAAGIVKKFIDSDGFVDMSKISAAKIDYDNWVSDGMTEAMSDEVSYYYILNEAAEKYNVTVEKLINTLSTLGYIDLSSKKVNAAVNKFRGIANTIQKDFLNSAKNGLNLYSDDIVKYATDGINNLFSTIGNDAPSFSESLLSDLSERAKSINDANTVLSDALKEQADSGIMASETYEKVIGLGEKYADVLEWNGAMFVVNSESADLLTDSLREEAKVEAEIIKNNSIDIWEDNAEQIENLVSSYDDLDDVQKQQLSSLISQNSELAKTITDYENLVAQLDYATSGYKAWLDAQNVTENGEIYDQAAKAYEAIKEGFTNGLINTKEFNAAAQFIVPQDIIDKGAASIESYVKTLSSYFKDGAAGVQTFLDKSAEASLMTKTWNAEIGSYEWNVADGIDVDDFVEKLNITKDLALAIFGKLEDYGFEFDFSDETLVEGINAVQKFLDAKAKLAEADRTLTVQADGTVSSEYEKAAKTVNELYNSIKSLPTEVLTELGITVPADELDAAKSSVLELLGKPTLTIEANLEVATENANETKNDIVEILEKYRELSNELRETPSIELAGEIAALEAQIESLPDQTKRVFNIDTSLFKNGIASVIEMFNQYKWALYELGQLTPDMEGYEEAQAKVESFRSTINSLNTDNPELLIKYGIVEAAGSTSIEDIENWLLYYSPSATLKIPVETDSAQDKISSLFSSFKEFIKTVIATHPDMRINGSPALNTIKSVKDALENIPKTVTTTIEVNKIENTGNGKTGSVKGYTEASGTANSSGKHSSGGRQFSAGTAYASGTWGIDGSGVALAGELGREIVVRDGRFFTVGDNGAEFFKYQPNDIVFNAAQTESILKHGKTLGVPGRGMLLYNGTAKTNGRAFVSGGGNFYKGYYYKTPSTGVKSGSSYSGSGATKEEYEKVDWIEVLISRIERVIDRLADTAANSFKSLKNRLSVTAKEIDLINEEIGYQKKAYDRYMAEANSVGLGSSLAELVRLGTIDINQYSDDTQKLISDYKEWYEKALAAEDALSELEKKRAEIYTDSFETIRNNYDNELKMLEHQTAKYNSLIDEAEERGYYAAEEYYRSLIDIQNSSVSVLNKELTDLKKTLDDSVVSGDVEKYSEEWYDMQFAINEVEEAVSDANLEIIKLGNNIRDLKWEKFDDFMETFGEISSENDFLSGLFDNYEKFDEYGKITEQGLSVMGLHYSNLNAYVSAGKKYAAEMAKINEQLANDPNNRVLIERRQELLDLQRDSIAAAEGEKSAIRDLIEDGINAELSSLKDLIDDYTDALESAKDLDNYQKKLADSTSNIASIQKQIVAYANDTSEESKARIQKLQNELRDAEDELEDMQYDRYLDEQKSMLDDLYNEYEETLNKRLDDISTLIDGVGDIVSNSALLISETISAAAYSVGYTLSDIFGSVWNDGLIAGGIYGDADNNGVVDPADARIAKRAMVGLDPLDSETLSRLDINGNGSVDADDARAIMRMGVGLDEPKDWFDLLGIPRSRVKGTGADKLSAFIGTSDIKAVIPDALGNMIDDISGDSVSAAMNAKSRMAETGGGIVVNIPIGKVDDYNDFITKVQTDSRFSKIIRSMTTDLLVGKNSLSKYNL